MRVAQPDYEAVAASSPQPADWFAGVLLQFANRATELSRQELHHLFAGTVMELFGAAGVCMCVPSDRSSWVVVASRGIHPWKSVGRLLGCEAVKWVAQAGHRGRAVPWAGGIGQGQVARSGREPLRIVVPLLFREEFIGAALVAWPDEKSELPAETLSRFELLASLAASLLHRAELFEQIELSRKRWVRVVDAIPDMILVHDEAGRVVRSSRSLAEKVSAHPAELVGREMRGVFDVAGASPDVACSLCATGAEGVTGPIEIFGERSFLVSTTRLPPESCEGEQTIHVLTNIRERLEAEAALQRERDFSQRILDNTNSVIVVLNAAGVISYINRRGEEAGYAPDLLVGRAMVRAVPPAHQRAFEDGLSAVLRGEPARNLELPILRRDGSAALFAINLSAIGPGRETIDSLVAVMTDITEASVLQTKLAHAEKMAALGRLVSGVAHEVNNPLAAIIGFTDLLLENPEVRGEARGLLGTILLEADRTKVLVQNLLRFARQMPAQSQLVNVNEVLRQALQLRSLDLGSRPVSIVERLADDLPLVCADPNQLQQVFLNIVNNAFDAIEETDRQGQIEVESALNGDMIEIRIRDNGPGVANPDHVFEPFFTTKPVGKGTGLGLSICYGIVRAHEGEILCQNNAVGDGCTFLIRLPGIGPERDASSEVSA